MKKLLFGFIATVMLSFTVNAQNLRADFLRGKTYDQVVLDFNKLSKNEKNALWLEKLNQLLTQNLPQEHKVLINKIKTIMIQTPYSPNATEFVNTAVSLAQITPLEDLSPMFESLYDYNYSGTFNGTTVVSDQIINDIRNINDNTQTSGGRTAGPCSCRWCIGHEGHTSTDCKPTEHGCGWFGMQSCNQCVFCT